MDKLKKILTGFLILTVLLSTMGFNLKYHTCKTNDISEVRINFDLPSQNHCSACMMNTSKMMSNESCEMESMSTHSGLAFNNDCCSFDTKLVKKDFQFEIQNISLKNHFNVIIDFIDIELIYFDFLNAINIYINEFLSGISPPYVSKYLHFISSLIE